MSDLIVSQLIELLKNCNPDAKVQVRYRGSSWDYSEEQGSFEIDTCEWGAAGGVVEEKDWKKVFIFATSDDKEDLS